MEPLKTQAIQTALTGDWNTAVTLNESILLEHPDDIDTLNRLAFAYSSIGNTKQAKVLYQKILTLDALNPIALRNIKRLNDGGTFSSHPILMNNIFIEEPGKTKVIELINVADKKILTKLRSGEHVTLQVKRMKIFVLDGDKQFVGMLPDDVGRRLIDFINGGNEYEAYVKTIDSLRLLVFIKETKRAVKFKNQPSFPTFDKSKFLIETQATGKKHAKVDHDKDDESGESDDESL